MNQDKMQESKMEESHHLSVVSPIARAVHMGQSRIFVHAYAFSLAILKTSDGLNKKQIGTDFWSP